MKRSENVLVFTYWNYPDALIQTYTLPYVRMIIENIGEGQVYLVTLEKTNQTRNEKKQIAQNLLDKGIHWVPLSYSSFGLTAMLKFTFFIPRLWWLILTRKINTIHAWCTPAGGIGYALSKLTGKRLILDSYEPHAEPMVEAGQWKRTSLAFKILWWLEKRQSHRAHAVIACVDKMRDYAKEKYNATFERFYWKPAAVDLELFHPDKRKNPELVQKYGLVDKVVFVYAGKFGGSYLTIEVFELLKVAQDIYGERFRALILSNHPKEEIAKWCSMTGLDLSKLVQTFVPHEQVPQYMGLGDVGLVPFVPVPSKRYGSPIKTGEYLAMGMPIIITMDISDDSEMVELNELGSVLKSLDSVEYSKAISEIEAKMVKNGCRQFAENFKNIQMAKAVYSQIYK